MIDLMGQKVCKLNWSSRSENGVREFQDALLESIGSHTGQQ